VFNLKSLHANPQKISTALKRKGIKIDLNELLKLDDKRKKYLQKIETLRHTQKLASKKISQEKNATKKSAAIAEMKTVSSELKTLEKKIICVQKILKEKLLEIPNPPHESVPDGGENDFKVLREIGAPRDFKFKPFNHVELGEKLDLLEIKRGVKTSGSRFYFLKNQAVQLEFALAQFIIEKLIEKGFTPMIVPNLVREEAMQNTGFFPAEREQTYQVNPTTKENPNGDDLFLIGTSEVPLAMFHAGEILDQNFPKRFLGWSTCYRRESGSYGKDTKGIFRVHQFDKLEMFSYAHPEKSSEEHEFLLKCQEEILQLLQLPYRVINLAAGDLSAPATKKYDCEVWIPSEQKFRELTSCSNCTDFQARRANIRFRTKNGSEFVHTLNGTACAMTRMLIAILENFQNKDSSVDIPKVLQKYMNIQNLKPKM
jgi:seryl-tRNA synthetase